MIDRSSENGSREVGILVSSSMVTLVAVPDVRNKTVDDATRLLETAGLKLERGASVTRPDVTVDTRKIYSTEAFYADVDDSSEPQHTAATERTLRGFIERRREFLLR